LQYYYV